MTMNYAPRYNQPLRLPSGALYHEDGSTGRTRPVNLVSDEEKRALGR